MTNKVPSQNAISSFVEVFHEGAVPAAVLVKVLPLPSKVVNSVSFANGLQEDRCVVFHIGIVRALKVFEHVRKRLL